MKSFSFICRVVHNVVKNAADDRRFHRDLSKFGCEDLIGNEELIFVK